MRKPSSIEVLIGVSALTAAGTATVAATTQQQRVKPPEGEFACYIHDKLSERHVGVVSAEEKVSGPAWKITYAEGGYAIYAQREGESCQLEIKK